MGGVGKERASGDRQFDASIMECALDSAYEAFYLVDEDDRIVYANAEAGRVLGYSREALQRMRVTDIDAILTPGQIRKVADESRIAGGARFETVHRRSDGSTFPVEILVSGFDCRGQHMTVALAHDIRERSATEEALHVSEERMRLFFERQLVGMAITSPEKTWLRVNRKICDMLGYTAEELLKMSWADVTHPDDLEADVAQFKRMLNGEIDSFTVEKRYIRKDGGIVHAALSIGCVRRADGTVDYVLALIEDVTERKHMENDLRQREEEARTLVEHSPDTIARYDRNCRRTFVNRAFAATVEGGAAALLGKKPSEYPGGPNAAFYEEKIKSVLATGNADEFELAWRSGEQEICSHIRLIPESGASGEVESVLAVGRDISERKRYEAELRKTKSMLRERNAELQAYQQQLEQRVVEKAAKLQAEMAERIRAERELEASRMQLRREIAQREEMREAERKRLAREVHDELGQILTGLKLHVGILGRRCATEASSLSNEVQEVSELAEQAMNVARNIAVVLRPVEAELGILRALELQASRFSVVTGIRCQCSISNDVPSMNERCSTALYRIVQELLTNVARHAQATEARVDLSRDEGDYVLRVSDNGKGFDAAAIGNGSFGLAGIRERVSTLGGTMVIDSGAGKGTEIIVHIPAEVCHD